MKLPKKQLEELDEAYQHIEELVVSKGQPLLTPKEFFNLKMCNR